MRAKFFISIIVLLCAFFPTIATSEFYVIPTGGPPVGIKISSLPFNITQPGYYYLSKSLSSGSSGILVGTANVTIDLRGYSLTGPGLGTTYGIVMNGITNVEVRNGTIRNFTEGIFEDNATYGRYHKIVNVKALFNSSHGIHLLGYGHIVDSCTASDNSSGSGIEMVAHSSRISNNITMRNGKNGITAGLGSIISKNISSGNSETGIKGAGGNTVMGNTAYNNEHHGIQVFGSSVLDQNSAILNNQSNGGYIDIQQGLGAALGVNWPEVP